MFTQSIVSLFFRLTCLFWFSHQWNMLPVRLGNKKEWQQQTTGSSSIQLLYYFKRIHKTSLSNRICTQAIHFDWNSPLSMCPSLPSLWQVKTFIVGHGMLFMSLLLTSTTGCSLTSPYVYFVLYSFCKLSSIARILLSVSYISAFKYGVLAAWNVLHLTSHPASHT